MTVYTPAPEVETIAEQLIAKVHRDLADVQIRYVFRDQAARSKGRTIFGKARVISGLNAWLAFDPDAARHQGALLLDNGEPEQFFVIEIAADIWHAVLDNDQQVALVDHELSHCAVSDDDPAKLSTVGHDLEEFVGVVARHGPWRIEVERLVAAAVRQPELPFDDDEGES